MNAGGQSEGMRHLAQRLETCALFGKHYGTKRKILHLLHETCCAHRTSCLVWPGVYLRARVPPSVAGRLLPYAVGETAAAARQQVQQQQQPRSSKAARRRDVWTEEERLLHTQAQEAAA